MKQYFIVGSSTVYGTGGSDGGWADMLKRHFHKKMYDENGIGEKIEIYNFSKPAVTTQFLLDTYPEQILHYGRDDQITTIVSVGLINAKAVGEPNNFVSTVDEYEMQIRLLFNMLLAHSQEVICVGFQCVDESKTNPKINPYNGTKSYFNNKRILQFQSVLDNVCDELGVKVVKVDIPDEEWIKNYQYSDGVHPNNKGYEHIFNKVVSVLES